MNSIDVSLYPDIFEMGGLISAMEAVAEMEGFDLGRVYSQYTSGAGVLITAEIDSSRGRISALLGEQTRTFYLVIQGQGFTWAEGATDDLRSLVRAVAAWRDGMLVDDFSQEFPFAALGRLARSHESGDPESSQWTWLLTAEEFTEERSLVNAAYADDRLRVLFPNLSHGTLRLSMERGRQGAREIHINRMDGGLYGAEDTALSDSRRVVDSLEAALAVAVDFLHCD
ncbi:hypothetical protein GCM10010215_75500 [Streptomyces virginiae]|uniref:Uncharacterized protein n=1 Tax=Streptomyces virginiae TaxID=1961 RepID=A0ABQ3NNX9_STRVG|nr:MULTISPECIES: DUF6193 family natural product biosynthesis protein [Streptomyces]GLV93019.1 hypothetical protein Slala04_44730 [Streptomyces lavendulae subsp. lavendulae]KOU10425.1 hypothetical protein ADK49_32680 [Streptomyces sp. WM6349]KOV36825.1 hypothetical protein ADK98_38650 [Streptomyces sp. H036]MBP2341652.1 hypothetical protein [Streptomyces virginiae]MCI4079358.1 DUF6193 family natural product biosynthesis protein [Streptomyces sp. MMS21 TC-5]